MSRLYPIADSRGSIAAMRAYGFTLLAALCLLTILAACEDPSNVGIGLIGGEQGGQPAVRNVQPSVFENAPLVRPGGSQPRVLAGRVVDPMAGTIEAEGYFDVTTTASSGFRQEVVSSAVLRLRPTYIYGDTTAEITFAMRPVENAFETGVRLPHDTTFSTGAVIEEFSFLPTDTLVVLPMPQSWVESHDEVLRSDDFSNRFHGFRLEHLSGGAVIGFAGDSHLRAFAGEDSAIYPVSRAYSAVRRIEDADIPADRLLYQAGVGPITRFELDVESIDAAAINHVKLVFQTDTLALSQKPADFRRPVLTTLDLYAFITDGPVVLIDRAELDDRGRFVFDGTSIALELQRVLLGTREIDHFEIRIPAGQGAFGETNVSIAQGSIDVQLFYDSHATEKAPEGFITITPLD